SFINPFIPSLINPCHNIFKPFDSISPIFKSVGLTELNLIQGEDDGPVRRFESARKIQFVVVHGFRRI
ncbi:hypothetical protein ACLF8F_07295, partial [Helicobacter pylori]